MDAHVEFLAEFAQRCEILESIDLCEEHGLTIVATLDDMMWVARYNDSTTSRHLYLLRQGG